MFKRLALNYLRDWARKEERKPLVLRGGLTPFPREVLAKASGKTERMDKLSIVCVCLSKICQICLLFNISAFILSLACKLR